MSITPMAASPAAVLDTAPEAELALRARGGERLAANELARRLGPPAYVLALQLLGDSEDARDAAQDALLRFFAHLDRLDPARPVRPWLFAIVRNASRDLGRRRSVRRSDSLDEAREERGVEVIDGAADPEADSRRRELQRDIWRALHRLDAREREILVLRDYQDLSYAEIADVLSIPLGTVMSRLHRARRSLRELLEAEYGPPRPGPPGGGNDRSAPDGARRESGAQSEGGGDRGR